MPPENPENTPLTPTPQPPQQTGINPQQAPPPQITPFDTPPDTTPARPPNKPFPILKLVLGVVIVLLIIGLSGAYYYIKFVKKTNKTEGQTPTQTESEWKLYTNRFAGYSFEYPTGWLITQGKGTNQNVAISSNELSKTSLNNLDLPTTIEIDSVNSVKSLEEVYSEAVKDFEPNSISREDTSLGGERAIIFRFDTLELGGNSKSIELFAKKDNKLLAISTLVESKTNVEDVFEHIRASFKFTTPERVATTPGQLTTKLDKYKGSDLYFNQGLLEVYYRERKNYPKDFNELLEVLKSINQTTSNVRSSDPTGQPYKYQPLDNQADYQISTILDDGTIYIVYGHSNASLSANDVNKLSDLSAISSSLNGYSLQKGKYPNKLSDLLPDWGIVVNNKPPAIIPKDPSGKDYYYVASNDNKSYELSAVLDNELMIYYRGN